MLIDWFTVGAQALNFLILVWLLKRFLYKPILDAIDAREKHIATVIADADAKKSEAQKERDTYQKKNEEFDQQRTALLTKATTDAKIESQRLLDEARQAADALRIKRQDALNQEQQNLSTEITRRTQDEVFSIARKTLTDLAGATLEERMVEVFTRNLQALNGTAKESLTTALKTSTDGILVCSTFALPVQQQDAIRTAINGVFSADNKVQHDIPVELRFDIAPDMISGIELSVGGQKVAWNISAYLGALEKSIADLFKAQAKPRAVPPATSESVAELVPEPGAHVATPDKTK